MKCLADSNIGRAKCGVEGPYFKLILRYHVDEGARILRGISRN
jgi:hypothetical protein